MKNRLWMVLLLFSVLCFFTTRMATYAQDVYPLEKPEYVPLTEVSDDKQIYTRLMSAVYLQKYQNDVIAAKRLYDELIERTPDTAFVWYKRGQLRYFLLEDIRGAQQDIEKALELNPSHVPATWQLAKILAYRASVRGGRYIQELMDTLKRVTMLDPNHFMAHQMLSDLAFRLSEYETAEISLKVLTRITPFEPQFHKRLGELYYKQKRLQEAVDAYQRVIKITPNDVSGNLGIGLVLQELVQRKLLRSNGTQNEMKETSTLIQDAEKYLGRAIFFSQEFINNPQHKSEIGYYRQMLSEAQYSLANVYIIYGKLENAEEVFKQLLTDQPKHIGAIYGISSVYQSIGEFEKAETFLRKTLTLEPAHEYALNALGYLYAQQGIHLDEAEALVKRALERAPKNGAYLDSLGWVYFKQGRFVEAVTTLESANQHAPNNVEILMHLGDAYLKNDEPKKARTVWQNAQSIEPENSEIQERLK